MTNKFEFLYSVRFWKLFLIGVSIGLNFPFPGNPWVQGLAAMIGVWFGGSVAVDTFDKATNNKQAVTTVSIPSGVSSVSASKEPTPAMTDTGE